MNKKLLTILSVLITLVSCKKDDNNGGGGVTGGIQITGADFIIHHSVGTNLSGYIVDSGIIAMPTAATNALYNYQSMTLQSPWFDTLKAVTNTAFSGATYKQSTSLNLIGQNQSIDQYYKASTSAWTTLGDDYGNNLTFSLSTVTASLANGTAIKTPSQPLVYFPISYADSFQSSSTASLTLNATIAGFTLPVTVNQTTNVTSKNIAWGTLKLSGYADSMKTVVQKYITTFNTAVVANALIQSTLNTTLNQFGFTNGQQTTTTTSYRFWVPGKGLVMTLNANGSATITTGL